MHTRLLLPLFLAMGGSAAAQIPNASFEDWSSPNGWDDPDGWITNNGFTSQYGIYTCEPDQPGLDSDFFIALTSHMLPGLSVMPGSATTGDALSGVEGFPYDQRPATLNGWWQHQSTGLDEGMVAVTFTKWNPGTQQRDDIGAGYLFTDSSFGAWYLFSVPIFYVSPDYPDTATITLASSASGLATDGSSLFVDELAFDSNTDIMEAVSAQAMFLVQLSPATDQLMVRAQAPVSALAIIGMDGRELFRSGNFNGSTSIGISALPRGCYLVRARFADGVVQVQRFVKP
jgi:hypothetical protein